MKLSEYFSSPIFDDDEGRKTLTGLLKTFLLGGIIIMPLIILVRISDRHLFDIADLVLSGFFALFSVYYFVVKRNRFFLSSILFVLIAWAGITIMALNSAGVRDVTISGYILLIFFATLLNGYRFGFLIAAISLLSFWTMAIRENLNLFIPEKETALTYARDLTVVIILVGMAAFLINRSLRYSYKRIRKELEERKKAQEKLSLNEQQLISKNIELIKSLERMKRMHDDLVQAKEEAEKSDRIKTSFLQNISHEVRTPMNGIVGFAELLRSSDITDEKREEYTKLMTSCTYQLAGVINDIIDISKIETGDVELFPGEFIISELLENDFQIYSASAIEKGIKVEISNKVGDQILRTDQAKISQVLNNLMSNAVKFTNAGSIKINFSREDETLNFSVSDTGIGIDKELIPVVFDRFSQAETGLDRSYTGAGLGLSISKGLINFMGGSIEVESEAGKGSTFKVSVPVEFTESYEAEKTNNSDKALRNNLTILIAEDDEISMLYHKEIFANSGHTILSASNGLEAIGIVRRNENIDLVLMDLKMPLMNGHDAARKIKEVNRSIPVIALTAYAFEEDDRKVISDDFDDYLVKPVDRDLLISRIKKVISPKNDSARTI